MAFIKIPIPATSTKAVEVTTTDHPKREIRAYRIGDRYRVEINGTGHADIAVLIEEAEKGGGESAGGEHGV